MKHLHSTISIQIIQEMEEHVKYNRVNQQKSDCEILRKKCFYPDGNTARHTTSALGVFLLVHVHTETWSSPRVFIKLYNQVYK